jgi:HKD family nuclease
LSEIKRIYDWVVPTDYFGVYAYATQSGVSSFELDLGDDFWVTTPSRWLFGLDYGRTQPQALRKMCEKENTDVRVVDDAWVIDQEGFLPRRDFHAKLSFLFNPDNTRFGMVVGSGNFSSNGLRKSVEAGAVLYTDNDDEYIDIIEASLNLANTLWGNATPAIELLDDYEDRWRDSIARGATENQDNENPVQGPEEIFWIEAGYVTKNRGANSPGNQIDFPRGMSRYFGFNPPDDLPLNSVIGEITFEAPVGEPVTRNLRLGNNQMEKISLPIPETHGFDIYDGKVLVFRQVGDRFSMRALEADDFETAFGDRLSQVRVMGSGRRFGHITQI